MQLKKMEAHLPPSLSARNEGSFAYLTVKDRLPVILTKIIDHLCREKETICHDYGVGSSEEIKEVVGLLSQLKNFIQTNKPIRSDSIDYGITKDINDDTDVWKKTILNCIRKYGEEPSWFVASWLFVECYMYKVVHCYFLGRKLLRGYDPFFQVKAMSCTRALSSIRQLCYYINSGMLSMNHLPEEKLKYLVLSIIQISLWGNQCDLSISGGADIHHIANPLHLVEEQRGNILAYDGENCWNFFTTNSQSTKSFALILDNAGYELVADFCLLTVLMELGFCNSVHIYPKTRPWFVSDTVKKDIEWTLNFLSLEGGDCAALSKRWYRYIENGLWRVVERNFWTTPTIFPHMEIEDSSLYKELCANSLIIFKGDLNYRKLVGDLDWAISTPIEIALQGFLPTSMLLLRTIKGGPVVGLQEEAEEVDNAKRHSNWNISGSYGVIQFVSPK